MGMGLGAKEKNAIGGFKAVGGLKCYLIADLIQDFEISGKNGQCLLFVRVVSGSHHMMCPSAPRGPHEQQPQCWACGENACQSVWWHALVWDSFS